MRKISAYSTSLLLLVFVSLVKVDAQDTIIFPLKIKVGVEVSGPALYFSDKNILSTEGYIAADINEKISAIITAGYLDYKYSQYNYSYLNKGMFLRTGLDFNLLKPDKSQGKYWGGIGLHYGLSVFSSEIASLQRENYWGMVASSVSQKTNWGHFFEIAPGFRAEVFKNFSIGWTVSIRKLIYTGTGKDLKPIYFPGYGNAGKSVNTGLSYFIVWNIPYKKKTVIIPKEVPEETDIDETGTGQQSTGIRQ
jgi:hypothetical protein